MTDNRNAPSILDGAQGHEKRLRTLRGRLAEIAPDQADLVWSTIETALQVTKTAYGDCRKCNSRVRVEIQDATAAVNAARLLIEQAEGRPGVAGESEKRSWKVVRFIAPDPKLLDLPKWRRLAETGELEALRDAILAAGHEKVLYEM